ncbi:MAG: DUF971 domain-containing protein [Melioribacteraceae bacterium]|nr:DUF971 domain-containing protein [Melioribacteraceae bacterium]
MLPKKISVKDKNYLFVLWEDDSETSIKLSDLRRECPCAICNSEKSERGNKYIPLYTLDQLTIVKISKVGKYALGIEWMDGHNTGIYEFGYLRSISDKGK